MHEADPNDCTMSTSVSTKKLRGRPQYPTTFAVAAPMRHDGKKVLPGIATDVYLLIFDQIEPPGPEMTMYAYKKIIGSLSLVCRLFRVLCQPRMFETIILCEDSQRQDIKYVKMRRRWSRLLASGDAESGALANVVRTCTLAASAALSMPYRHVYNPRDSVDPLLRAIPAFRSLETFTLRYFSLSASLFETLARLPNLTAVTIRDCPGTLDQFTLPPQAERCGWTNLSVEYSNIEPFIPIVVQLVDRNRLRRLVTDNPELLDAVLEDDRIYPLQELNVTIPSNHPLLFRHLEHCPSVMSLVLQCPFCDPLTLGPLSDTVMPELRSITSYPDTVQQFLGSRPITKITILDFPNRQAEAITPLITPVFEVISTLEPRVQELSLPLRVIKQSELNGRSALPNVPRLTLVWNNFEITHLLSLFTRPPGASLLQVAEHSCTLLSFDVRGVTAPHRFIPSPRFTLDLKMFSTLLHEHLPEVFPKLSCLQVNGVIEWCKNSIDGIWRPRVIDRSKLKEIMENPKAKDAQDVEGCLAGAFLEGELSEQVLKRLDLTYSRYRRLS